MITEDKKKLIIPLSILENMISECPGDKQEMLDKALVYLEQHRQEIFSSLQEATLGLILINSPESNLALEKKYLKEITDIYVTITKLRRLLSASRDMKRGKSSKGVFRYIKQRIFKRDYRQEDLGKEAAILRLEDWHNFLTLLDSQTFLLEDVKQNISTFVSIMENLKETKSGPKPTTQMLSAYILQIAKLYEHLTKMPFKINNRKDGTSPGFLFAKNSVPAIDHFMGGILLQLPNYPKVKLYTDSKIFNACEYARDILKNSKDC